MSKLQNVRVSPPDAGFDWLVSDSLGLLMRGQSPCAYGTLKLVGGEQHIDSVNQPMPNGRYVLDGVSMVTELAGIGPACAREARRRLREELLVGPRESFTPCHGPRSREASACN